MGLTITGPKINASGIFSWQEVKEKGYVVAHGKVYDISSYTTHPGGSRILEQAKGTDATAHYDFHTKTGRKVWERYCIGKLRT